MYVPGTLLLWVAFLCGLGSMVAYAFAVKNEERWLATARQTFVLMSVAVFASAALLMYLLITHDYRLSYVYAYSDNAAPLHFLISCFWAGQEGSFLLWIVCAALLGFPLMRYARTYETRAMLFYNASVLSLVILLLKQNPFRFHEGMTAGTVPLDGNGLNPLLQNPWMVIHPPVMFLGYASLAIPFAFALAALWMRKYDDWVPASLPWVLLSVFTLGTAIMMGGYWAYETLGWGGYWGWDPVENASLVPWLTTVALLHGMLLQRGRNRFRRLNLVLAISSYLLVVYATFLTRSGVLSNFSVHSFVDLGITGWLVVNMAVFVVLAIGMMLWRWREIPAEIGDEPFFSRTIFYVLGILQLILIALVVVFGTSAPLISRLWGEPSTVGPDFYNRMGFWVAVLFCLILGAVPFLGWQRARADAKSRLIIVLAFTAAFLGLAIILGVRSFPGVAYIGAALFCVVANVWATSERAQLGLWRLAGGSVSHVGMGLMILAFLTTGWYDGNNKMRIFENEPAEALGYTLVFRGVEKPTPEARDAMVVEVTDPRGRNFVLKPLMWINQKSNQLVANPDIKSFLTRDLYIAPVEYSPGEEATASGHLVLSKDEPAQFRDWVLSFEGFDMDGQHNVEGVITVGMVIKLERPGLEVVRLHPSVVSSDEGVNAISVDIPGMPGSRIRTIGMNVNTGQIRVELLGLGGAIGREAMLSKGERLAYEDLEIMFEDFDMSNFDPEAGKIDFGVVFNVVIDGETIEVVPTFSGGNGEPVITDATVPGSGGVVLSLGRVDAENGRVEVKVFDPKLPAKPATPPSLVIDISTKPLIILVWIGTLLVMLGTMMAIIVRAKELEKTRV